ncbi:unnamed protein product [Sphagnum troendelagicum]|uniref:Uncharacterized protein n=1 Tax=Sphagnum troendelagicum TaxID=128251 RepID=A0ABP0TB47_9BRYO
MQSCGSVATSASSPESKRTRTYNAAQQDAEKRKEHADKGLDRRQPLQEYLAKQIEVTVWQKGTGQVQERVQVL